MRDEPVYAQISSKHEYESKVIKPVESFESLKSQITYLDGIVQDLSHKLKPFLVPEIESQIEISSSIPENCSPYYTELHHLADRIKCIRIAIISLNERIELP